MHLFSAQPQHHSPTLGDERRGGTRVNADFLFNAVVDGDTFMARSTDLSVGGLAVLMPRARRQVAMKTGVGMQFQLPYTTEMGWAVGRVSRHRSPEEDRDGMALRFTYLTPCTKRLLRRYVSGQRLLDAGPNARCRGARRVRFDHHVSIVQDHTGLLARGLDISADGLRCIRFIDPDRMPMHRGQEVGVLLHLPKLGKPIEMPARIARRQVHGERELLALRFGDAGRISRIWLEGWLAQRAVGQA